MKKLFTLLACIATMATFAQAPQGFNYQATVRNSAGALITNQIVEFKFSIKQTSASGTTVYSETQDVTPDNLGQVSLVVGTGSPSTTATFAAINWASGTYYLAIELNTGAGFLAMGTTQLLSVPYALYANNAGNTSLPNGNNIGDVLSWNGIKWVVASLTTPVQFIILTTTDPTAITTTTASSGGTISSDGGISIIARGVCWSTYPDPTTADSKTTDAGTTGTFTSNLTDLSPGTTFYVRAYATNSLGTNYGTPISFTTPAILPTLTTKEVGSITVAGAISGADIYSNGGADITEKGVCWSTNPNPTTADSKTIDYINGFDNNYRNNSYLIDLSPSTFYYVRAYAINSTGTAYGNQVSFTTTAAESNGALTIGTQVWTTKNLDVATYSDGTLIPEVQDPAAWAALTTGAWCYYNNTTANGTTYGKLYNWYAVAGIHDTDPNTPNKKLAPSGYHISSDDEWTTLTNYLTANDYYMGIFIIGGNMKATGTSLWNSPNTGATNSSGFSALPGGYRSGYGTLNYIGYNGYWWSLSEGNTTNAWARSLNYDNGNVNREKNSMTDGFSVRCLRD